MTGALVPVESVAGKIPASEVGAAAVQVFTVEKAQSYNAMVIAAGQIKIGDAMTEAAASALAVKLHAAEKEIKERNDFLRKPAKSFLDALCGIVNGALVPVTDAKATVKRKLAAWGVEKQREKDRLHAEALAKHAAEVAAIQAKAKAEADALRIKAEQEARELAELMGEDPAPIPASAEPMKAPELPPAPPAPKADRSAVVTTKRWKLFVDDPSQVPYQIGETVLMSPLYAQITKVYEAGGMVPGCRYEQVESVSMRAADGAPGFGD